MALADNEWQDEGDKPMFATGVLVRTLTYAVTHPIEYTKVLIQIGYEPLPAYTTKTLFGRPAMALPNVFRYMKYIRKTEGYLGLFRGFGPRLCENFATSAVCDHVMSKIRIEKKVASQDGSSQESDKEDKEFIPYCHDMMEEIVGRCIAVMICHPLHVVMVRSMSQFVGKETHYQGFFSPLREIYKENGVLGYFSGLVPRIIGEACCLFSAHMLIFAINHYLVPSGDARALTRSICQFLASTLTYPFVVVSNTMAVSGSRVAAGQPPNMPIYISWIDCWEHLQSINQLKRGSSLLWRPYPSQAVLIPQGS